MGLDVLAGGSAGAFNPAINTAATGAMTGMAPYQAASSGITGTVLPTDLSMIGKGGQLSSSLQAGVNAQQRRNQQMANAERQKQLRGAAYLGRGGPSGAASSASNVITRGQQEADTSAYQNAMAQQAGLNLAAGKQIADIGTGFGQLANQYLGRNIEAIQAKQAQARAGIAAGLGLLSTGMSFIPGA